MANTIAITPEVLSKLREGFGLGLNISEACLFAGISRQTYYNYIKENPDSVQDFEHLQDNIRMHAKTNIAASILKSDIDTSKWYAERKSKEEFSLKSEMDLKGGFNVNIIQYAPNNNNSLPVQSETVSAPLPPEPEALSGGSVPQA